MRPLRRLLAAAALALAGALIVQRLRRGAGSAESLSERRADPDPQSLEAARAGQVARMGFDLRRLEELKLAGYHPVVEHLSYIQVQRGESESLVFVRNRDLEALASLAGLSPEEFLEQSRQMGVLLSMN